MSGCLRKQVVCFDSFHGFRLVDFNRFCVQNPSRGDVVRKLLGTIPMPETDRVFINLPVNSIHILCFFSMRG